MEKKIILLLGLCCIMINPVFASSDLVAEIDYYPKNVSVGDNVTVVQTIKNVGEDNLTDIRIMFRDSLFFGILSYFNISGNSEINSTFNFTIKYGRVMVKTIADTDNVLDETNETNNNATLLFDFPVSVETDKKIYLIGEPIKIYITGNWSDHIDVVRTGNPLFLFNVFKFENKSWNKRVVRRRHYYPPCNCENGTLSCPKPLIIDLILTDCAIIPVNSSWSWDQTQWIMRNLTCGNKTYNKWEKLAFSHPGIYKSTLTYTGYYEHSPFYSDYDYGCYAYEDYVESNNFTIADSILSTNPESATIPPNASFTILINISGNNIHGAQFDLYFNSTVLEAINVTEGNFLKQNCTTNSTSQVNNTIGKITFADTCIGIGDVGVNGSGVLYNVTFKAKSNGSSALNFDNVKILNSEHQRLYVAFNNAAVISKICDADLYLAMKILEYLAVGDEIDTCYDFDHNDVVDVFDAVRVLENLSSP